MLSTDHFIAVPTRTPGVDYATWTIFARDVDTAWGEGYTKQRAAELLNYIEHTFYAPEALEHDTYDDRNPA